MSDSLPLYEIIDPCIDGYLSTTTNHLMFGARRLGPEGLMSGNMNHSIHGPISDEVLGNLLADELALALVKISTNDRSYKDLVSGKNLPQNLCRKQSQEFSLEYAAFTLWTKNNPITPYFIGVPISEKFPMDENYKLLNKPITPRSLGMGFRQFVAEFII